MRYLLLLALLLATLIISTPTHATDANEADAHLIAVNLGVYDPINGDARWVYTDTAYPQGALIVSYRVQNATNTGVTIVRVGGVVQGRWERNLATNELDEVVFVANNALWTYLGGLI